VDRDAGVVAGIRAALPSGVGHDGTLDAATLEAFAHGMEWLRRTLTWRELQPFIREARPAL
jgi:hypothetical protein